MTGVINTTTLRPVMRGDTTASPQPQLSTPRTTHNLPAPPLHLATLYKGLKATIPEVFNVQYLLAAPSVRRNKFSIRIFYSFTFLHHFTSTIYFFTLNEAEMNEFR